MIKNKKLKTLNLRFSNDRVRTYKLVAHYQHPRTGKQYSSVITVRAYDMKEALEYFNRELWELDPIPDTSTTLQRGCDITVRTIIPHDTTLTRKK